jgi:hypothetical protein
MQTASNEHKKFGQPVVSAAGVRQQEADDEQPLTPAQAAARFQIPEYLLRKACAEGRPEHLGVVNAIWLSPDAFSAGPLQTPWRSMINSAPCWRTRR